MAEHQRHLPPRSSGGLTAFPGRLPGVLIIASTVHRDDRGWFQETYRADALSELGVPDAFVQWNHSRSARGVLRGLHFQVGAHPQAKLVRCVRGNVFDVVVDLRRGSPTFGHWEGWHLSADIGHQVYCPTGFAHGFVVLSDGADLVYGCSDYYDPDGDRTISPVDEAMGIAWPGGPFIMSARDASAPTLALIADELPFVWSPSS